MGARQIYVDEILDYVHDAYMIAELQYIHYEVHGVLIVLVLKNKKC